MSKIANPSPIRMIPEGRIYATPADVCAAVAQEWMLLAQDAIAARGAFHVALSGGSTPRQLYERLAAPDYAYRLEWNRTFIYFGDERAVWPDDEQSNYRMASEALLSRVSVPPAQVFRINAERADLKKVAMDYSRLLAMTLPLAPNGMPQFDLLLLGMGDDGHVASLFPGTDAAREQRKLVMPVYVQRLNSWRVSLTFNVINHARHVMLLACGNSKAAMVRRALRTAPVGEPLPVQCVKPVGGHLEWRLDQAAAALLK
ncbi:MAG: 6-phosphogluconolactonase [Gammaproteobacteria bacterium]|nr:6-phosphogluconolactonase [Gammaproteobacteria bacterium]